MERQIIYFGGNRYDGQIYVLAGSAVAGVRAGWPLGAKGRRVEGQ